MAVASQRPPDCIFFVNERQYNMPTSHVGLAGATAGIEKFFQAWINKL